MLNQIDPLDKNALFSFDTGTFRQRLADGKQCGARHVTGMKRDHGGGLDAAAAHFGGARADWLDLSTGINPVPYPVADLHPDCWTALPDRGAMTRLKSGARRFWNVPAGAQIVAASGASALIARMPDLTQAQNVAIPGPTYNEHEAAFRSAGLTVNASNINTPSARVFVHPNNPDGVTHTSDAILKDHTDLTIIDESFCDEMPERSHVSLTDTPRVVVLKSFGKFWGLAGLRLGFAIATPHSLSRFGADDDQAGDLEAMLGPWAVSGPALEIGARALEDMPWAAATRTRLAQDAARLDRLMTSAGAKVTGGTTLFRLYEVDNAADWQTRLAEHHIWTRVFPYNPQWLRLGLPAPADWPRLESALA